MAKLTNTFLLICLIFSVMLMLTCLPHSVESVTHSNQHCKELNQFNCYSGKNEGYYCNSKDQTTTQIRWYYDKGTCHKFNYKGCNGNRNRFCSKESCLNRCYG
ncbi:kunitz-type U15-theraphotoxin-Hhn1d [Musca domestica]|uniref:Kunitz-type U15-theraphotoxin-Hhn1d n=1 Tax=Musca domestica TaxID=7370 RepID=A0A1I8NC27_MUSDO|nr:kunitz-type U15-theraphotoxin-Hhn1d [Musca domestica]